MLMMKEIRAGKPFWLKMAYLPDIFTTGSLPNTMVLNQPAMDDVQDFQNYPVPRMRNTYMLGGNATADRRD